MKLIRYLNSHPVLSISMVAALVALLVSLATYYIMRIYQTVQPIWVEQAAYVQAPMLTFWFLMNKVGFWHALFIMGAERHLLQLLIFGLFAPSLLTWFHAPIAAALPAFTIFIGLFGWTIYKRTAHLGYSAASMLLFCSIAQLTGHKWGIGSGFADWQSMLLLSAAALSLINAFMKPGIGWIRSFSIFVSLTVLARTTSVIYTVIICGPILILYFVDQYKRERSLKLLGIILLNILIFILPVAVIVIGQLANMFAYYSPSNASQLRQPLLISAENIFLDLLIPFLGIPLVVTLVSLFLLNVFKGFSATFSTNMCGFSEIAIGWWILGYLGFLLANGYTSNVPKEVMYVVPALLLFSLSPVLGFSRSPASFHRPSSIGLTIFSVVLFIWNSYQNAELAKVVSLEQATMRSVQRELANQLVSLPSDITWQSYTSIDWGIPVSLITQYEFREYRQHGGVDYFYNKEEYWDTWYPDMSLSELQDKLYDRTVNCIDAVVILRDSENQPVGMDDYSYFIAAFIAERIKNDSNWEHFENLAGWPVGTKYQIYLNKTPESTRSCQDVMK